MQTTDGFSKVRWCPTCRVEKPLTEENFRPRLNGKEGFRRQCTPCIKKIREAKLNSLSESEQEFARKEHARKVREDYHSKRDAKLAKRRGELKLPERKRRARDYDLRRAYGITIEQYEAMLVAQMFSCKLCGRHMLNVATKTLVVDHDHNTGKVRGLLCVRCNSSLGSFNDDPAFLRKAADYLEGGVQ